MYLLSIANLTGQQTEKPPMQLAMSAPRPVLDAIASMGRTEDIRFSPDRRRLAVAAILRAQIFVFDIEVRATPEGKRVHLGAAIVLSSEHLLAPHGLDFVDNDTLAIASREGELCLFRLPPRDGSTQGELELLQSFPSTARELLGPGSVAASRRADGQQELLVCRNFGHRISRHVLDAANGYALDEERVLLGKWLDIPDGISLDPERRWLAVSSHNTQSVLLYPYVETLDAKSDPQAVLRGASYPHGLRFSDDGRYLLLADAGAPYVHVYHQPDGDWQGVYDPNLSLRVMDDALFRSGNENPQEGGPKGIDIDCRAGILVTSCQTQALAFYDLDRVLASVERSGPLVLLDGSASSPTSTMDVYHELEKQQRHAQTVTNALLRERQAAQAEQRAAEAVARASQAEGRALHAEALLAEMTSRAGYFEACTRALLASSSWRITAPLRKMLDWRRRQG